MAILSLINERQLICQLRNGDELAFEELYRHYVDPIYRKLLYLVKSPDIAEELAQDVFMRIWEKRASIDPDRPLRAFIFTIAQNLVTDCYRRLAVDKKLREHLLHTLTERESIEAAFELAPGRNLLAEAMESLPPQRKKVISLVKLEGKSYEEASQLLGISTSTIRDHVVKGTKALKSYFAGNEMAVILAATAIIAETFRK